MLLLVFFFSILVVSSAVILALDMAIGGILEVLQFSCNSVLSATAGLCTTGFSSLMVVLAFLETKGLLWRVVCPI
jgi:hypothetical protein